MPACGQAVGCGVCYAGALWRGAAGLCARTCTRVRWYRRIFTYIHTCVRVYARVLVPPNLYIHTYIEYRATYI